MPAEYDGMLSILILAFVFLTDAVYFDGSFPRNGTSSIQIHEETVSVTMFIHLIYRISGSHLQSSEFGQQTFLTLLQIFI